MSKRIVMLAFTLVIAGLAGQAGGQQSGQLQPAHVRVLLPQEDASLQFEDKSTKQKGVKRSFVSPPLELCRTYSYKLTATWEPNNYTKIIRTRTILVHAGREVEVDLRKPDPKNPDKFLIRYVPTPEEVVEAMCKLAGVNKGDVVYDLGCGDGRIVITAVKDFGAKRGVGVDIDPLLVKESQVNAKAAGVANRVQFRTGDVLNLKDLGDASVVMMYMGEDVNLRMRPILKQTLKPGSRIVSHDFRMGDWKADKIIQIVDGDGEEHVLYLWKVGP